MGFSLVAQGLLRLYLPDAGLDAAHLVTGIRPSASSSWSSGRQELFTQTTLTAVVPLFSRRNIDTLLNTLRVWGIVLVANLAGAVLFAVVVVDARVRHAGARAVRLRRYARGGRLVGRDRDPRRLRRLIALVVWLLPLAGAGRLWMIVIVTYFVGLGSFSHIIAGSVEVMFAAIYGGVPWQHYLGGYLVPTLIGNTIGGASLVAALNTAQVAHGE